MSFTVTCCHLRLHVVIYGYMLSFTVTCCHLLSRVVIYSHVLSFTVTCSHLRLQFPDSSIWTEIMAKWWVDDCVLLLTWYDLVVLPGGNGWRRGREQTRHVTRFHSVWLHPCSAKTSPDEYVWHALSLFNIFYYHCSELFASWVNLFILFLVVYLHIGAFNGLVI